MRVPNAKNTVVASLVSTIDPTLNQHRRTAIEGMQLGWKKPIALRLHDLTTQHADAVARLFGLSFEPLVLPYVGAGGNATVFRLSETEVLKADWQNVIQGRPAQTAELAKQRANYQKMAQSMGSFAIPQHSFIGDHPGIRGNTTVCTVQNFRKFIDPRLMPAVSVEQLAIIINDLQAANSDTIARLQEFNQRDRHLQSTTGLLVDRVGASNVVMSDETPDNEILILDGQPITTMTPLVYARALQQRNMMDEALALVA